MLSFLVIGFFRAIPVPHIRLSNNKNILTDRTIVLYEYHVITRETLHLSRKLVYPYKKIIR